MEPNRWYAWHMLPGYGSDFDPYVSPILVQDVKLLKTGKRELELTFFNAFYAAGVQDFKMRLKILTRRSHHLLAIVADQDDPFGIHGRDLVIGQICFRWLQRHLPEWYAERPKRRDIGDYPLDAEKYLSLRFFGTEHPWRTTPSRGIDEGNA